VGCCKVAVGAGITGRMEGLAMFEGGQRLVVIGHYKVGFAMVGLGDCIRLVEQLSKEVGRVAIVVSKVLRLDNSGFADMAYPCKLLLPVGVVEALLLVQLSTLAQRRLLRAQGRMLDAFLWLKE